jgi:hypothetical protein
MGGYQSREIDMTPFIAGGRGPKQNMFFTSAFVGDPLATGVVLSTQGPFAGFVVSGKTDAAGTYDGAELHDVIVDLDVKLTDFIGELYIGNVFGDKKDVPAVDAKASATYLASDPRMPGVQIFADATGGDILPVLMDGADGRLKVDSNIQSVQGVSADGFAAFQATKVPVDVIPETKVVSKPLPSPSVSDSLQKPALSTLHEDRLDALAEKHGFVLVRKNRNDPNSGPVASGK